MADVGRVAVAEDVGGPLVLGGVGVTSTDVTGLESLKVLKGAQLVGHCAGCGGVCLRKKCKCVVK